MLKCNKIFFIFFYCKCYSVVYVLNIWLRDKLFYLKWVKFPCKQPFNFTIICDVFLCDTPISWNNFHGTSLPALAVYESHRMSNSRDFYYGHTRRDRFRLEHRKQLSDSTEMLMTVYNSKRQSAKQIDSRLF